MILIPKTRQLQIISFAIAGFTAALFMGTFLVHSVRAEYPFLPSFVYTESNTPTENGNSILGFWRNADGNLIPLPNGTKLRKRVSGKTLLA